MIFDFSTPLVIAKANLPFASKIILDSHLACEIAYDPNTKSLWACQAGIWNEVIAKGGKDSILAHIRKELEDAMLSGDLLGPPVTPNAKNAPPQSVIYEDISHLKGKMAVSIMDRIESDYKADMLHEIANSPWSAWENVAIRWDQGNGKIVTEPLASHHFCIHKQNYTFPASVSLLPTPRTTAALTSMLGPKDDDTSLRILECYIGAALLKFNPKKALWLRGEKGIGKSTYTSIFASMLPEKASVTLRIKKENNFLFTGIIGKSAVIQPEMPEGVLPHQDELRSAIRGEQITLNEKGKDEVTIFPKAIWICASNYDINIGKGSTSTLERFCYVTASGPIVRDTPADVHDFHLQLLEAEGYEIRIRCIARFVEMMENNQKGWKEAQGESKTEMNEVLKDSNAQQQFFHKFIERTDDRNDRIYCIDFAKKYMAWFKANNGTGFAYTEAAAKKFLREGIGIAITTKERQDHKVFGRNAYFAPGLKWREEADEIVLDSSITISVPCYNKFDSDSLLAGF